MTGDETERVGVLVVGGGIAGLWALDSLVAAGFDAVLVEREALGSGQTIAAQGIIHGGGKYALRGVGDVAAMRAIRDMPDRWRSHLDGRREPSLDPNAIISEFCDLWLARGSWVSRLLSWGMLPLLRQAGVLATKPKRIERADWPQVLLDSAWGVHRMAEPVLNMSVVLESIAQRHPGRVLRGQLSEPKVDASGNWESVQFSDPHSGRRCQLGPDLVVLSAGVGNELLSTDAQASVPMQRRPLRMLLLRGQLPVLYGHCVAGGKTKLTVTTVHDANGTVVWQVGGELSERYAHDDSDAQLLREARRELRQALPGMSWDGVEAASYIAVRAEAADPDGRRPSGVHIATAAPRRLVAWPTKLALAPLLADEITVLAQGLMSAAQSTTSEQWRQDWPRPAVATAPWEAVEWTPFH